MLWNLRWYTFCKFAWSTFRPSTFQEKPYESVDYVKRGCEENRSRLTCFSNKDRTSHLGAILQKYAPRFVSLLERSNSSILHTLAKNTTFPFFYTVRTVVGVVTDSRLTTARLGQELHLKPGREYSTPLKVDVRDHLEHRHLHVKQYSYTGLKAFADNNGGRDDRKALFRQIKDSCSEPGQTPTVWFCIIGVNDFKYLRQQDVATRPGYIFQRFIHFFENLRHFSPNSTVVWLSVGNARTWESTYDKLRTFRTYLLHPHTVFPPWLAFQDIAGDCTDLDVKDRFGHWENHYIKRIAERLVCFIKKATVCPTHSHRKSFLTRQLSHMNLRKFPFLLIIRIVYFEQKQRYWLTTFQQAPPIQCMTITPEPKQNRHRTRYHSSTIPYFISTSHKTITWTSFKLNRRTTSFSKRNAECRNVWRLPDIFPTSSIDLRTQKLSTRVLLQLYRRGWLRFLK